jgi:transcription-repair coupling factor (superfamily II helicase)
MPVGPDRRTPLRDIALLENLRATLTAVLDNPVAAAAS